jgi:shikimate 5-dehydrogenase
VLGRLDTGNTFLSEIAANTRLLHQWFGTDKQGMSVSAGAGGAALSVTYQLYGSQVDDFFAAHPDVVNEFDKLQGRGLARARAGAGATRR